MSVAYTQTAVDAGGLTITWPAIPNGATGTPAPANPATVPIRSVSFEATGTWGSGGSVQIEGSNDGVNYYKLSPAALGAAGMFATGGMELPRFFQPHVTAGDGTTSITVVARFNF